MATKIKIVTTGDFLEVTPEGTIDITTSRQLLVDIAKAERSPVDYDLLIDFRDTRWNLSTSELYQLASELPGHGDTFRRKVAVLIHPGVDFDSATFFETCSHNRGFEVNAFTDFESAIRWFLSPEDTQNKSRTPNKADTGDDK
jgi:hypothetical protein